MANLYKYKIFCLTDNRWEYIWLETPDTGPLLCPTNHSHAADVTSVSIVDVSLEKDKVRLDGRKLVHQTSRTLGTTTYFTCRSDNQADPTAIGGSVSPNQKLILTHNEGDPLVQHIYMDINCITNETHLHEGYLQWKDAANDEIFLEIVPKVTPVTGGVNTTFNLYGGYLVVPAAGNGVIAINPQDIVLVQMPVDEFGMRAAAFWNATFNENTKLFENLQPAPYGNGEFNIFAYEVVFNRFVNGVPLLGSGFMNLQTSDTSMFGHNMRIKCTVETKEPDRTWSFNAILVMHRVKTS